MSDENNTTNKTSKEPVQEASQTEELHVGDTEQTDDAVQTVRTAQSKRTSPLIPAITGVAVGAIIVGAVWGIMAHNHPADPLVASVGGLQIHQSTFNQQMEDQSGQQTLQTLIADQLIKDGAKATNITASQTDLKNALQSFEMQYNISSSDQLTQFLAQNNVTQAQLNDILTVQILEEKLAEKGITVSDKEVQDYYNANKAQFTPQGAKSPQPLSKVKTQVVDAIKQSKATPAQQLLANLAKKDKIVIYNTKYSSIKDTIENPPPATSGLGQ